MKLLASFVNKTQIETLDEYVDGYVVGSEKFNAYASCIFSREEIISLSKQKSVYVLLNSLLHEEELKSFEEYVNSLKGENIYYIVGELGAYRILKKLGLENKTIYNSETMITNYMDALSYPRMDGIAISNEITIYDASLISKKIDNGFYLAFGYHPMYRSYRKIFSLYKKETGMEFSLNNLSLKEETRNQLYPSTQNDRESVVFRGGVINTISKIDELKNMKYLFLDNIFVDLNKFNEVVKAYSLVLKGKIVKEEGIAIIEKLNLIEDNTFMENDSRYEVV